MSLTVDVCVCNRNSGILFCQLLLSKVAAWLFFSIMISQCKKRNRKWSHLVCICIPLASSSRAASSIVKNTTHVCIALKINGHVFHLNRFYFMAHCAAEFIQCVNSFNYKLTKVQVKVTLLIVQDMQWHQWMVLFLAWQLVPSGDERSYNCRKSRKFSSSTTQI